jgi:hypothetical protein
MVDKEQQISESNQMYGQLNQQLEVMLDTIARETEDIKKLEMQLNDGTNITRLTKNNLSQIDLRVVFVK